MFDPADLGRLVQGLLPYWDLILLAGLALACAHRERGQGHSWLGTQGARLLFWGTPVGLVCWWITDQWHTGVSTGLAAFVGMLIVPHGAGQNLRVPWKDKPGQVWPEDDKMPGVVAPERLGYLLSAATTRLWYLSLALVTVTPYAIFLPFFGVTMPAGYLAGLIMPKLPWRLTRPTEWGELFTGLGFGIGIATIVFLGRVG